MRRARFVFTASAVTVLAGLLALGASPAAAQATGSALDRFNPADRGSDWFSEDSLDLRGHFRPAIGIVGDYADHPLVIVNANGSTNSVPVADQLILHPGAALNLYDRARFSFDLPVGVFEDGHAGAVKTVPYAATSAGGLGDLHLGVTLRLVGQYGDPFRLAAGVGVFLPTGSQSAYLSDGTARVDPRVAVAGDVGPVVYAAHVAFQVRPATNEYPGYPTGSELDLGGSVGVRLADRRLVIGPEVEAGTVVANGSAIFSTRQTPVDGLLGAHFAVAPDVRIGAGVGMGLTRGFGEPLVRATFGVEWMPHLALTQRDRDHDGIPDEEDACPDVAGVPSKDPTRNGCPLPDRDKDGVPDEDDACPDVPGVKTPDRATNGCPPDRDHDGIPDSEDACPDQPGVRMSDKSVSGCAPDSDHDGIPDAEDACPDRPGIHTDDPSTNGCPDPDRDKDGIPNAEDDNSTGKGRKANERIELHIEP